MKLLFNLEISKWLHGDENWNNFHNFLIARKIIKPLICVDWNNRAKWQIYWIVIWHAYCLGLRVSVYFCISWVTTSSVFRGGGHAAMPKCPQNAGNAVSETQISKTFRGGMPPDPLQSCRHYGLPLTKILATPLVTTMFVNICMEMQLRIMKCFVSEAPV